MTTQAKTESRKDIQKVKPQHEISPFDEMDRMFDSFFPEGWLHPFHFPRMTWPGHIRAFEGKMPRVDIIDREDEILVKAELPGVEKKDLDISVTQNTVSIKARTSHEEKEEKGNFYRCEISSGAFSRTLSLPADVNEDKVKATFKDGMLELTMPKLKKAKRHNVKVQ